MLVICSRCKTDTEHVVLQTLMYACQRMENDKQLREYHVPPVRLSPLTTVSHLAAHILCQSLLNAIFFIASASSTIASASVTVARASVTFAS